MSSPTLIRKETFPAWIYELTFCDYGDHGVSIVAKGLADEAINAWINECRGSMGLSLEEQNACAERFMANISKGIGSYVGAFSYGLKSYEEISLRSDFAVFQAVVQQKLGKDAPVEPYWLGILEFANEVTIIPNSWLIRILENCRKAFLSHKFEPIY